MQFTHVDGLESENDPKYIIYPSNWSIERPFLELQHVE